MSLKRLSHGMLLDAKCVMDDALPDLAEIRQLIPEMLHDVFDKAVARFEDSLCYADVSKRYKEIE